MSKKDTLYFLVIWGTILFIFLASTFRFASDGIHMVADLFGIIIIGLLIWMWFGTGYRVENDTIHIKTGPFRMKINIQYIRKISKEKSILSSAALAVDRLVIHYGRYNQVQIAPKKESEFVNLLLHQNPQIELDEALIHKIPKV